MAEITAAILKKKGRVLVHLADQPEYNSVGYTVYEIRDNMGELNWYPSGLTPCLSSSKGQP